MKKIVLPFIIIFVLALMSACGGPAPAVTESPVQPAATQAPAQPAANDASATTNKTQVEITLADNTIESSLTSFQVGVPYTFVITNTGRHAHNFNINTPVSVAGSLNAALDGALLSVPQDRLGAGATATVDFTFPDSAAGTQLEFSCLIRRHYEDGMKLDISVSK